MQATSEPNIPIPQNTFSASPLVVWSRVHKIGPWKIMNNPTCKRSSDTRVHREKYRSTAHTSLCMRKDDAWAASWHIFDQQPLCKTPVFKYTPLMKFSQFSHYFTHLFFPYFPFPPKTPTSPNGKHRPRYQQLIAAERAQRRPIALTMMATTSGPKPLPTSSVRVTRAKTVPRVAELFTFLRMRIIAEVHFALGRKQKMGTYFLLRRIYSYMMLHMYVYIYIYKYRYIMFMIIV